MYVHSAQVVLTSMKLNLLTGSFYRKAIPKDITDGAPQPGNWGPPSAALDRFLCDPLAFFKNHTIILSALSYK